ncbi:MAG: FAD-dependent oxidoreductase, partial [Anaerolineae bacterium]|nr:FAD-dependent oxidoreductase [Anaerolineae bacterium]NIN96973.1 FAD-dependent oxidoreductase [Anaerolineae bacterium]NIQ82939.1 FAD-dependent oxidoreductase [Anaerolineae bacterium]
MGPLFQLFSVGPEWFLRNVNCRDACPARTDVPGYIAMISAGQYDAAYFRNKEANLFPAILGRVCTHECEAACRRGLIDEPVAICALKRFAADQTHRARIVQVVDRPQATSGRRVAIIGSGPVGLTAAHELALYGHQVTIFESGPVAGGMLYLGIPEYRLPREFIELEIATIRALGVELRLNTTVGEVLDFRTLQEEYDAVLIAVGAHKGFKLQIPGEEEYEGVYDCIDFLRRVNLGDKRRP